MVIDTFPLLDSVVVAILDLTDRLYIVVENVVPTLVGARSLLGVLRELGYPADRQRLIINRFATSGGRIRPPDIEQQLGLPVSHVVRQHKQAIVAANTGVPYVLNRSWVGPGRATRKIVAEVERGAADRNGRAHHLNGARK